MPDTSPQEQLCRTKSLASVLGTHAMEGLFPSEATLAILRRYAEGELTPEAFSAAMDAHALSLLPGHGKLAGAA